VLEASDVSVNRRSDSDGDRIMVDQDEKQRVFQASLEYWKAAYEYFKTFATICLASIAAFSALLAGVFDEPPKYAKNTMLSLVGCSSPSLSWFRTLLSWFGNHRWIFWVFMAVLTLVVLTSVVVFWLRGTLIPCLSKGELSWFKNHRSIWMTIPFIAFTVAGIVSLSGTHFCRKALWYSTVTDKTKFEDEWRYKRLFWLRAGVWLSYGIIATIDFFIIALLSIPL
jgi:uncharacterized membrane protein